MELVGYEDVEARSHEALASLVVHKYMEDLFDKMNLNYYETWNGERGIRTNESK